MNKLPENLQKVAQNLAYNDLTKFERLASNYAPIMNEVQEQIEILKTLKKGVDADLPKAKRVYLDLGKIVSRATTQKKTDKEMLLLETRVIDGLFNAVEGGARLTRSEAKEILDHAEKIENERLEKLNDERIERLRPYLEQAELGDYTQMSDADFDDFVAVKKLQYERKNEAEKQAEKERQKEVEKQRKIQENKEALLPYKLFIDNFDSINFETVDLTATIETAQAKKAKADAEAEAQRVENERLRKEAQEREAKALAEQQERERLAKEEKAKQDAILAKERAEKQALIDAENARLAEIEKQRKEAEELAKAPVKKQLNAWIDSFEISTAPIENEQTTEIINKFNAFKAWAKTQIK